MDVVNTISFILSIILTVVLFHLIIYYIVAIYDEAKTRLRIHTAKKNGTYREEKPDYSKLKTNRFAFLIAARNEEIVIEELIKSIQKSNYPMEYVDIYLVADNCSDKTAEISRNAGAIVYERFNTDQIGKGYAMKYLLEHIRERVGSYLHYDGYFVFDADNILDPDYINAMNKKLCEGHRIVTGYRNSKNFDTNWVTGSYSIAFLREAKYLNNPRSLLHSSCAVSGTGYMVAGSIIEENDGWPYQLLTEDIQLSTDYIVRGEKVGYSSDAIFYDEQPTSFIQGWNQRIRWTKGFYQVLFKYGKDLLKCMFKDKKMWLSRWDMFTFLAPSLLFNVTTIILIAIAVIINIVNFDYAMEMLPEAIGTIISGAITFYLVNLGQAALTVFTEWDRIRAPKKARIKYCFFYPIHMLTYIPISVIAIFSKSQWKPIKHTCSKSLEDVEKVVEV